MLKLHRKCLYICKNCQCSFPINTLSIYVTLSPNVKITSISSLLNHAFIHIFLSPEKTPVIFHLPYSFHLHHTLHKNNPIHQHVKKSYPNTQLSALYALCISHSLFNSSQRLLFFHIAKHTHKSYSAHPL